jgi:hypothetical protein
MSTAQGEVLSPLESTTAPPRLHWFDAAFLLVSPLLAWVVFDINLINQDTYVDPWFYTGYGQSFEKMVVVYRWTYYALRFPVVFLNTLCCSGDAPAAGYSLLRYALVLLAGVPLYILAQRHFGRVAAVCSYLFLFCNALFLRVILWDLTPFVSVPAALAGICIWLLSEKWRLTGRFVAGALFAASISSHVFTITAIGCFVAVDSAVSLRSAESRRRLARELITAVLGAVAMIALGTVYYVARLGEFDPRLLFSVNLFAMRAGSAFVAANSRPFPVWIVSATYIYVPVTLLAATIAMRRALARSRVELVIVGFLAGYCAFYAVYCYFRGSFILHTFYYFGHLTIAVYLIVPLVVGLFVRLTGAALSIAVAFVLALLLPLVALRFEIEPADRFFNTIIADMPRLGVFWTVSLLLVMFLAVKRLPRLLFPWVVAVVVFSMQLATLADPVHRRVFDYRVFAREHGVYLAGVEYVRFVTQYDTASRRVLVWTTTDVSLGSVTFTMLGDAIHAPFTGARMPTIGERERERLALPQLRYVMMLATRPEDIASGKAALESAGIRYRPVETRRLGDSAYSAVAELIEIVRAPGSQSQLMPQR